MYELQVRDIDGWVGIHSGLACDMVKMGQDLEPYVSNPLRVVERAA